VIPTGTQIVLHGRGLTAIVTEVGATLRELSWQGRPLVAGFGRHDLPHAYQGAVLAPWPNRLAGGRYRWGDDDYQLPLSEPERLNALHGLVCFAPWQVADSDAESVTLTHRLWPQRGYPFPLDLRARYELSDHGLTFTLTAVNAGDAPAPYGASFHPYLIAGGGRVDDWTVQLPAATYLTVDPDRLLPVGTAPVGPAGYDFRSPTSLRGIEVDHAFTDLTFDDAGTVALRLVGPGGRGVGLTWDRGAPWVQLCIPDENNPTMTRQALAVEPMTCAPDAFNSGVDLITLPPGGQHTFRLTIAPIETVRTPA
jgi:aldose 1-epimerase